MKDTLGQPNLDSVQVGPVRKVQRGIVGTVLRQPIWKSPATDLKSKLRR